MEENKKRELVSKLKEASQHMVRISTADHFVIHEQIIDKICEEYSATRNQALLIINEILNK